MTTHSPRRHDATTRRLVGAELRRLYEAGASLKGLARATGYSVTYVRTLLIEADTRLRAASRPRNSGTVPARRAQATEVTPLAKGKHLDPATRREVGAQLRTLYEAGASVRELVQGTGRSYGFVHRLLLEAGATSRGRGGASHRHRRL